MEAFLQTLIGGLLALGGAFVGQYFQRQHDRWKAEREDQRILRDKAQEMFDELDRVIEQSRKASASAAMRMKDASAEITPVPDLGRIRAIAAIYFPSSLTLIADYEKQHAELMDVILSEMRSAIAAGDKGLETLKAMPLIMTGRLQEFTSSFVTEMRNHLATNSPKLELATQ